MLINYIKRKKYKTLRNIILVFIMIFTYIYIKIKDKYYCKNWDKGLNNTHINNNVSIYSCSINIPKEKCLIFQIY